MGRASHNDSPLLPWPPRSPDLTPWNFLLWGYIKDCVYIPPMPCDLPQLRQRIMVAVAAIDRQMLQRVCRNLITELTSAASPRVDISSTCNLLYKIGVYLPLLTFSPSVWPSRLLYRRVRKSRRDL